MTKLLLLIFACCSLNLMSCNIFNSSPQKNNYADQQNKKIIPIIIVDNLPWAPNDFDIDPVTIEKIEIICDTLRLRVSYGGGCKTHTFTLYCSTFLYKSNPPQRDVWLSHDANGDNCEAYITEWLSFHLSPLRTEDYDSVLLRIYEFGYVYGKSEPIRPLPLYKF